MRLLMLEVAFVLCVVVGVGLISLPWALILGGVCGVFACERAAAQDAKPTKQGGRR